MASKDDIKEIKSNRKIVEKIIQQCIDASFKLTSDDAGAGKILDRVIDDLSECVSDLENKESYLKTNPY
jgi:hypothetical protein|nr:MAG TPA: hypothetical protein [Caudoviricetes sp.]